MYKFLTFMMIATLAIGIGLMYDQALSNEWHLLGVGFMAIFTGCAIVRDYNY